ncbi:hypothetical protein RJ639_014536 [Escallonia herrerae]|uniref:F-box domain-containing protein n=1 Tax=Escallonia herrerae TaxID=1293975 RepID=A0AA88VLV1_9ASTE|nr:hypothetical protein RJ639_014536 [Escallonia herrerae]
MSYQTTATTSSDPPPATSPSPPPPPLLIPNLPDDVAIQCIARVPRSYYPTLSLTSRSWRSTVRSPHLFTTRSLLRSTQHFLYISVRINSSFTWHLLDPNPQKRILAPLPPIPAQSIGSAFVALGPKIYVIGGSINDVPSNNIWVFDCRINRWEIGPKMRVGREFAAAGVVGGKIYVLGGCVVDNWARSMNWAEVFDPVSGSWAAVASPIEVRDKWMHASAVVGGRVYAMADRGGVIYDALAGEWGSVSKRLDLGWRGRAVVVGGVLYCYDYLGKIRGFDVKENVWKDLKGVDEGLPKFLCGATMADLDGRLCVVWESKGSGKEVDIMCAEIEVWKDEGGGLCGSIVWSDGILVVPNGASIVHCLAVSL